MTNRRNRYKDFDRLMTLVLIGDGVLFLAFLFFSGFGVIWGKVLTGLAALAISGVTLAYLYMTNEWLKRRSFWMTVASAAVILCTLVSLICNYPSPNKLKQNQPDQPQTPAAQTTGAPVETTTAPAETTTTGTEAEDGVSFHDHFVI